MTQTAWEVKNPTPAPSYYGQSKCTTIQSIVAFKLASMSQHGRDEGLVYEAGFSFKSAIPKYEFETQGMWEFFEGRTSFDRRAVQDVNDPHGLLGSRVSTEAQLYLTDFLLEPARMQYRMGTLADNGMHKPILTTNPDESYWEQLRALQSGFQRDWAELGRTGNLLILHDLLKLDYTTTTLKSTNIIRQIQTTATSSTSTHCSPAVSRRTMTTMRKKSSRLKQSRVMGSPISSIRIGRQRMQAVIQTALYI